MNRSQIKENKIAILQMCKEKKKVLFRSFQNNAVTKQEKEEAWLSVLQKAQSLGLTSANRSWTYARDHLFGLWKSRTLAKRDNANKTGTGGGKSVVLDEVDELILDIIGKESPVVGGLDLREAHGAGTSSLPNGREPQVNTPTADKNTERVAQKRKLNGDPLEDIKRKVLESELYINKLKIYKMEKELQLPYSEFTKEFYASFNRHHKESPTVNISDTKTCTLSFAEL